MKRLILRPYKKEDANDIIKWLDTKDTFIHWGGKTFKKYPITPNILNNYYLVKNGDYKNNSNFYCWMVTDINNNKICHYTLAYSNKNTIRLGQIIVNNKFRNKGYGKKSIYLGIKYAFEFLNANKITLCVFKDNIIALNCYKSLGFKVIEIFEYKGDILLEMELTKKEFNL